MKEGKEEFLPTPRGLALSHRTSSNQASPLLQLTPKIKLKKSLYVTQIKENKYTVYPKTNSSSSLIKEILKPFFTRANEYLRTPSPPKNS